MPKIWKLRLLVVVIGILSSNFAFAQQPKTTDGNFLKQGTDAWNRVHVTKNASSSDHLMATSILFYVLGVFDVHRHNNFVGALMVNDAFQRLERREATKLNAKEIYEIQAKTI